MAPAGRAARRHNARTPPPGAAPTGWSQPDSARAGPPSQPIAARARSGLAVVASGRRVSRRHLHPLRLLGQPVLRGDLDWLEEGADRRRVDVLHPGEVVERSATLGGESKEVAALLDALAAVKLRADQPQRAGLGQELHVGLDGAWVVPGARDPDALGEHIGDAQRLGAGLAD